MENKKESFKIGGMVYLIGKRFSDFANKYAEVKELDDASEVAILKNADDITIRADYSELKVADGEELSNLQMNSVKEEDGENRPIGVGTGKERDSWNLVAYTLKGIEKELHGIRVPVTSIRYESCDTSKWHNALNTMWEGAINFTVDFMGKNGEKHSATISVPIENGQPKQATTMVDNLNRSYELNKEGVQNFLQGINYTLDPNKDETVYNNPGQEEPTVANIFGKGNNQKLIDMKYKIADIYEDTAENIDDNKCPRCGNKIDTKRQRNYADTGETFLSCPLCGFWGSINKYNKEEEERLNNGLELEREKFDKNKEASSKMELTQKFIKAEVQRGKYFKISDPRRIVDVVNIAYLDDGTKRVYFYSPTGGGHYQYSEENFLKNYQPVEDEEREANLIGKFIKASNYRSIAKKIMSANDFDNFQKLLYLREMYQAEIEKARELNKYRGAEKDENINYEKISSINADIENILSRYQNTILQSLTPQEISAQIIDRIVKQAKEPKQADIIEPTADGTESELNNKENKEDEEYTVDENGERVYKKKETRRKEHDKNSDDPYQNLIATPESGHNSGEYNDMSIPDSKNPRFQS